MEEGPGVEVQKDDQEVKRSQRPPKPLTHRLNKKVLQDAYHAAGLLRPEITRRYQDEQRTKNRSTRRHSLAANQENKMEQNTQQNPNVNPKPGVGGTQQHQAQMQEDVAFKAVAYGATGFAVGTALIFVWKGATRWLG